MTLHADAIAENGAAGERTRRIDGDDGDAPLAAPPLGDECVDECRLAGARGARDADDMGTTPVWIQGLQSLDAVALLVLEQADQSSAGALLALERPLGQFSRGSPGNARLATFVRLRLAVGWACGASLGSRA